MQKIINVYSIRMVRTELDKMLRKDYESHKIHHGFNEHRVMEVGGGIAPCVKENHGTVTAIVEVVDGVGKNKTSN